MESEMAPREAVSGRQRPPALCTDDVRLRERGGARHGGGEARVRACPRVNNRGALETCALLYMQIRQLQSICTRGRASGMGLDAGTMSIGGLIRLRCHTSSGFTLVAPPSTPEPLCNLTNTE